MKKLIFVLGILTILIGSIAEAGVCTGQPNGTPCTDDHNPCTNDICQFAVCTHNSVANGTACTDDGDSCTTDSCQGGVCTHPHVAAGTACATDSLWCNGEEQCDAGGDCIAGAGADPCLDLTCASDCDEATDTCPYCQIGGICYPNGYHHPKYDCKHCTTSVTQTDWQTMPDNTRCKDDRMYCNGEEWCISGVCVAGAGPDPCLEDGFTCTPLVCNEYTDTCNQLAAGWCFSAGVCSQTCP